MASKVPESRSEHLLLLPTGKYCLTMEEERWGPLGLSFSVFGSVLLYTPASLNWNFISTDNLISKGMCALTISSVETNQAWEGFDTSWVIFFFLSWLMYEVNLIFSRTIIMQGQSKWLPQQFKGIYSKMQRLSFRLAYRKIINFSKGNVDPPHGKARNCLLWNTKYVLHSNIS